MLDIVVSDNCPHCEAQLEAVDKSFFHDEYRVIRVGSPEFETYPEKSRVNAVPFVIVRDGITGAVKYAAKGVHDGTALRQIERRQPGQAFNLKSARELTSATQ
jgi:hypothetical protein